ncbi:ABC transporter ATP-binding protein [Alteromonadaceae bacterium BrNp21-10]|nr:ABC transporter ATP-binding protein [Alteromonadaceae bacterium BrNp21-10]
MSDVIAQVENLSKAFAGKAALCQIDLSIHAGEILAILGPNGAGKTTLINLLLGRIRADSGSASLFGYPAGSLQAKRLTGAMLQIANLPDTLTIAEHIELFQSYYANPMELQTVLDYAGLSELQSRSSKKLSGGEKQRLLFALAICGNPRLLFLDEPSVAMDVESRRRLWQSIMDIKASGAAIVLTTHYLDEADHLADRIIMLNQGKIIQQGSSADIKAQVASKVIRFMSDLATTALIHIPAITNVVRSGKYVELHSTDANASVIGLCDESIAMPELSIQGAALEDAFLHCNQHAQSAH